MTSATQQIEKQNTIESLIANTPTDASDWLGILRAKAAHNFAQIGLPTSKHEDWRFTNINPIRKTNFTPANGQATFSSTDIKQFLFDDLDAINIVFVNGHFDPGLSHLTELQDGVRLVSLAAANAGQCPNVEKHLGKYAQIDDQAFTAANTAMIHDGVYMRIKKGTTVEKPIHIINISVANDEPIITHPRTLIIAEPNTNATIIEDYVSLSDDVYLTNAVTEIVVQDNADITHYMLERESKNAFNISSLFVNQKRDSRFTSHSVLLGGHIVRNNINPVLDGENCYSVLNGVYVIQDNQIADNHMQVVHAKPHCDSRQYYNGIMNDQSKGVFRGRIIVKQDAQQTDAKQSNQNLLLSDDASVNTDPQLEIYADDVKCTHGATIGQLDKDQIFYLQARGIPAIQARAMVIQAFAAENLERMNLEPIRNYLQEKLLARLAGQDK